MVRAVVTLMHFHGLGADRERKHVIAEAKAENRFLLDQLADDRHRILAGRGRIARPVGEESAVRFERQSIGRAGGGWHHGDFASIAGKLTEDIALDPVIDGDDVKFRLCLPAIAFTPKPRRFVPGEALPSGDHRHEIHADETRPRLGFAVESVTVEAAGWFVGNDRVGHALLPDQRGQRAGVDAGKPDHAAALEPLIEMPRRTVVRWCADGRVQHDATRAGRRREVDCLNVLVVGADIADMREGEGDDLPGIGRIGQDLLIASHRGIEADLADRVPRGAEALSFEYGAVGKDEERSRFGLNPAVVTVELRPPIAPRSGLKGGLRSLRPPQACSGRLFPARWLAAQWLAGHGLLVAYYMSRRNHRWALATILSARRECGGAAPHRQALLAKRYWPSATGQALLAKPCSPGHCLQQE